MPLRSDWRGITGNAYLISDGTRGPRHELHNTNSLDAKALDVIPGSHAQLFWWRKPQLQSTVTHSARPQVWASHSRVMMPCALGTSERGKHRIRPSRCRVRRQSSYNHLSRRSWFFFSVVVCRAPFLETICLTAYFTTIRRQHPEGMDLFPVQVLLAAAPEMTVRHAPKKVSFGELVHKISSYCSSSRTHPSPRTFHMNGTVARARE